MKSIVNFAMRCFGLGKAVDALDGETSKAYTGGIGNVLLGASGVLGGLAGMAVQLVGMKGGASYLEFGQNLGHNPATLAVLMGAKTFMEGWTAIGQRHAIAKAEAAAAPVLPLKP